jgi:hypothetical protein
MFEKVTFFEHMHSKSAKKFQYNWVSKTQNFMLIKKNQKKNQKKTLAKSAKSEKLLIRLFFA